MIALIGSQIWLDVFFIISTFLHNNIQSTNKSLWNVIKHNVCIMIINKRKDTIKFNDKEYDII